MGQKRRLIFVDDDLQLLQGLRRRLSGAFEDWETTFVSSGKEALEKLAVADFDVIVTDMRMPEIDGAALLERVRLQYPQMARIVLSGQSDNETIYRALGETHQFLSKPCNTEQLRATVNRTCALRDLLNSSKLREILTGMSFLPSLPELYLKLNEEVRSPNSTIKSIAAIVGSDIGMTAKILQIANSEFFGLSQSISSVEEAVRYLGIETLRSLSVTINIFSSYEGSNIDREFLGNIWKHSLIVGVYAKQIMSCEGMSEDLREQSFTAGLLHDIGKVAIALNYPEQYKAVRDLVKNGEMTWWEAEEQILNASHMIVGAYLLNLWGLPESIVEAVAFHHQPSRCEVLDFLPLTAVHLGNAFYYSKTDPTSLDPSNKYFDLEYLEQLGALKHLSDWRLLCEVTSSEKLSDNLKYLDLV